MVLNIVASLRPLTVAAFPRDSPAERKRSYVKNSFCLPRPSNGGRGIDALGQSNATRNGIVGSALYYLPISFLLIQLSSNLYLKATKHKYH